MICEKKKYKIKKYTNIIECLIFISNNHPLYNYISHLIQYILDKHRKYNLTAKMYEPTNILVNKFKISSFPSSIIIKDDIYFLYNGFDINQIEKCIQEFIY